MVQSFNTPCEEMAKELTEAGVPIPSWFMGTKKSYSLDPKHFCTKAPKGAGSLGILQLSRNLMSLIISTTRNLPMSQTTQVE